MSVHQLHYNQLLPEVDAHVEALLTEIALIMNNPDNYIPQRQLTDPETSNPVSTFGGVPTSGQTRIETTEN